MIRLYGRRVRRFTRRTLARPHRTLVVPILAGPESEHALALACRIAADRRSRILVLAPLFVESELPLDAHFHDEECELHEELARARALVESYGVLARGRIVRVREGQVGRAVADEADATRASLIAWSRYGEQICAPLRRLSIRDLPHIVALF